MDKFLVDAFIQILNHPNGVVCKHWMLLTILDHLERSGETISEDLVRSLAVNSEGDELSLAILKRMKNDRR